jgi:hypothetical protein
MMQITITSWSKHVAFIIYLIIVEKDFEQENQ